MLPSIHFEVLVVLAVGHHALSKRICRQRIEFLNSTVHGGYRQRTRLLGFHTHHLRQPNLDQRRRRPVDLFSLTSETSLGSYPRDRISSDMERACGSRNMGAASRLAET